MSSTLLILFHSVCNQDTLWQAQEAMLCWLNALKDKVHYFGRVSFVIFTVETRLISASVKVFYYLIHKRDIIDRSLSEYLVKVT